MVVNNQKKNLNFGEDNSPEINLNSNLKRWFSRNLDYGNLIDHIFLMKDRKLTIYA